MKTSPDTFNLSVDRLANEALKGGWVSEWVRGAILPREMIYFLARCEEENIDVVIESGRQDGYSTKVMAEWARSRPGLQVHSIDWEGDADVARRCRERLAGYERLHLHKGDANLLIPKLIRENLGKRLALIVDGPKGFWAVSLMFASLQFTDVKIISLHNLSQGTPYREFLERHTKGSLFYEQYVVPTDAWKRCADIEIPLVRQAGDTDGEGPSTLGVIVVDADLRKTASGAFDSRFKLFQPPVVSLGWKFGADLLTSKLFNLSFRIWS